MKVALYARVSTERQQERGTISSQLEALRAAADADGHEVIEEFVDDGYSGARLDRPALDRLRDAAEAGVLDGVICLCADRLARVYAYQVLIIEELARFGVSVRFLEGPAHGEDPQATLLVQMQGVIAEYERAKIAERYRRGKLYRARARRDPVLEDLIRAPPCRAGRWRPGADRDLRARGRDRALDLRTPTSRQGRSIRQIAFDLLDRGIPSPTGKPIVGHLYDHAAAATTRRTSAPSTTTAANATTATARAARGTARPATASARARSGSRSRCRRSSTVTRSTVSSRSAATTRSGTRAARSGACGCCAD